MQFLADHWFAFALFGVYTAMLLWNARSGFRRSGDIGGYLVGNRQLGGVVIGVSFVATFASTNSYLGLAGKSFEYGAIWLLFAVLIVVFTYLSWRLVAPRLRAFTQQTDAVTVPEFLGLRFASWWVRPCAGVIIALSSLLYLVAIFKGAGNLFEVFLRVPYEAAVGIMLLVVLFYTSVGGFVSVVRTDVIQGVLMVVGSLLLFTFVTHATGGVGSVAQLWQDPETEWLFTLDAGVPFVVLLGIALAGAMKLLIDPRQISRFYGLRDAASVSHGIWYAVFGLMLIQFCLFPLGLYAHHLLDGIGDTDLIVPTLIQDRAVFPILVADFLVVAILSAAMSSMDSVLLVSGSAILRDVVHPVAALSEREHVRWTRLAVIAMAIAAAAIALRPLGGIVEITIFSGSLYAVCFAPAVMLGLYWRKGNGQAVLCSFAIGIGTLLIWRALGWSAIIHEVLPALLTSVLAYVVVALVRAEVDSQPVSTFFSGVQTGAKRARTDR